MPKSKQQHRNNSKKGCHQQGQSSSKQKNNAGSTTVARSRDIAVPAAMNAINITPTPVLSQGKRKSTVVKHREFLDNLTGNLTYEVSAYALNPGLSETFPWLFNTAKNYEKYRVNKFMVEILTNSGSSASGTYGMAIDYNAADPAPNTEQTLMAFQGATNCSVWNSCRLIADKFNARSAYKELFVRTGNVPEGEDLKTFDMGTLYVYTSGSANDALLGKIYVDYEIEFYTPQLGVFGDAAAESLQVTAVSPLRAAPFGTGGQVTLGGLNLIFLDGDSYSSPVGSYLVAYELTGTVLSGNVPVVTFTPASTGQVVGGSDIGLVGTTLGIGFLIIEVFDPLGVISWDMSSVMGSMSGGSYQFAPFSALTSALRKPLLTAEEVKRRTKLKKIEKYQTQFSRLPRIRDQDDPAVAPIQMQPVPSCGQQTAPGVPLGSPYNQAFIDAFSKRK